MSTFASAIDKDFTSDPGSCLAWVCLSALSATGIVTNWMSSVAQSHVSQHQWPSSQMTLPCPFRPTHYTVLCLQVLGSLHSLSFLSLKVEAPFYYYH